MLYIHLYYDVSHQSNALRASKSNYSGHACITIKCIIGFSKRTQKILFLGGGALSIVYCICNNIMVRYSRPAMHEPRLTKRQLANS